MYLRPVFSVEAGYSDRYEHPCASIHRLLVAIVRRAVWDFVLYRDADPKDKKGHYKLAVDAAAWLFWDGEEAVDDEGRYTFKYICSILGMNPKRIREASIKLTRREVQRLNNNIKAD